MCKALGSISATKKEKIKITKITVIYTCIIKNNISIYTFKYKIITCPKKRYALDII
jgi:hypothetical protein